LLPASTPTSPSAARSRPARETAPTRVWDPFRPT
jgi:hypothetical protein